MLNRFELSNNALVPSTSADSPILVFVNPDPSEKDLLRRNFCVDDHTLLSALDPDEVPRMEIDGEALSLIWKRPMNYSGEDNFYFNVASVGLFLRDNRLAVVLTEDISIAPTGARKVQRFESPLSVALAFLYETINHYLEHLKVIKMISRDLQKKINTSMENKHLIQMFNLSESLTYYANAISGNNAVLARLRIHAEKAGYAPRMLDLLDDLIIECTQCFKQAEIYSTVFSGLMDARGSLVNNNMNVLLKNLTIINIVFLPLNLIASIGGMSEFSMMTGGIDWRLSYSLFFAAMVVIGWFTAYILGKMGSVFNKQGGRA
jgi:magnesium transporter